MTHFIKGDMFVQQIFLTASNVSDFARSCWCSSIKIAGNASQAAVVQVWNLSIVKRLSVIIVAVVPPFWIYGMKTLAVAVVE